MEGVPQLQQTEIEIGARNKEFFILTPKQSQMVILKDATPKVTDLKRNELKDIEVILKAVLIDKVIPTNPEIVKATGIKPSTLSRRIKKMKGVGIKFETPKELVREVNEYTGEIFEKMVNKCSYVYYDNLPSGDRLEIDNPNIHRVYGKLFGEKLNELKFQHRERFDYDVALNVSGVHAWKEINEAFDLHKGNRAEKWIVSSEYKNLIIEKYGHH